MDDYELLERSKTPTSKKKYVGIEIEFLTPQNQCDKLEKMLIKEDLQWYCHLGGDGSVKDIDFVPKYGMHQAPWSREPQMIQYVMNKDQEKRGHEIRILAQEDEAPGIISKVCEVIKACGGVVNKTCGLHVHVDLRSRVYETVYHNMFMVQNLMFATQPLSRTKGNKFCRKLPRLLKSNGVNRYYAINKKAYKEHKTIEIRLHEPSLEAKDILMWTGFLIKIADINEPLKKKVSTVEELPWLPETLKGHLNERIQKYSRKQNTKTA